MIERFRAQAMRAVVGSLAVILAGCGSQSGSPAGPTTGFSAGTITIAPAGAIVGTAVTLESRASDPTGGSLSYSWDFGDGATATGVVAAHAYDSAGDFFVNVSVSNGEGSSAVASLNIPVRSLTARWSGDLGVVSITQDGLDLRGTYEDASRSGVVAGRVSETGTVTFTVTSPGVAPITFTGTAGPEVGTLVGSANGRDLVNRPATLARR